ncbi:type III effector protein [Streptomyces sp. ME02-8801-2C]|uniref:type III effector protein n=1 Tax=Streptomyces sp. ME02-8801-2C TaxID=3028680 RepID=UPI0029B148B2|nr:type III effector protein [Streptomyces sp. ME02-8801-2C]MDX3457395.1 type III effector protein [Streptomyces sp. ME02-8801-2C]
MTLDDQPAPQAKARGLTPTSFLAAATALNTIHEALHTARASGDGTGRDAEDSEWPGRPPGSEQALAALLLLREVRDQLAEWEPGLIEEAREAGASWADLAHPLGVSSRQAAERRYLRVRPGIPGSTGEQRVRDTRDRRAAARTVTTWARANAADLRQLAGQITALTDLPAAARTPLAELTAALADNDTAALVAPLTVTGTYLTNAHPDLAARVDDVTRHTEHLRDNSDNQRQNRA